MPVLQFSEIKKSSDIPAFPSGLSFFDPYLEYHAREVLSVGGDVQIAKSSERIVGLFLYDSYEKTGSIYTRFREVFDRFQGLKPSNFLFSEIDNGNIAREVFDIYVLNLEAPVSHAFKYELSQPKIEEIERFMLYTHPNMNPSWPRVALNNGDRCFVVKLDGKCVGCAWVSSVNGVGRLHTLYVNPQYRRIGIGEDLLYARLLWLKLKENRLAFSEISENNIASSAVARKANMLPCGHVYMYLQNA
jgi:ribosomal protein S18 acetylase RimI-like enzyme